MAARDISKFFIYRWRYVVGYSIIGLLLAGLLVFAGLYVPGGISTDEMHSAVMSENISLSNPSSFAITSLPFHLLQSRIFDHFGVSDFTIKLPSLIMSLFAAIGLILLLRRWFSPRIAVLTSFLAITTGQFLFVAQNGSPGVSYIFWPILLLLLGTQVTRAKRGRLLWKLLFAVGAALSLYNPLSIYPLFAIALATVLHPHLRAIVRRLSKVRIAISLVIAAIIITPLILSIIHTPQLGLSLLGIPTTWPPDLGANAVTLLRQYFLFWAPSTTTLMTPVFGLGSVLIIGLGIYRLIRTRDTTRSYLLIIWIACLIPVLLINPKFTSVTFVPAVLLLAAGLTSLIGYWYRLFPLNPYARIAGLIPLIILVLALVGSGLDRYIYGYHYDPNTAVNFSRDLKLLPKGTTNLVVGSDELAFYQVVAKHREGLHVSLSGTGNTFTVTREAKPNVGPGYTIVRIITAPYAKDSDRLYIYKKMVQ
jgi:4-amino-4-deoxy-L-arabinose transferase-like glycosyltransferase